MQITSVFGQIEIEENGVIEFEQGLVGLSQMKRFVLLQVPGMPLDYMQSLDDNTLCFPVLNPFKIIENYSINIGEDIKAKLQIKNTKEAVIYTIVVVPDNIKEARTNLLAPLIVNPVSKKAVQIVLNDKKYDIKYNIYDSIKDII